MVCDLCFELVVERQFPLVDQHLDVLREVVDVLSDLGVVFSEVRGDRLVTSGAGHDHIFGTHSVCFLYDLFGAIEGVFVISCPEERRCAAPLVGSEDVHLNACSCEDTYTVLRYALLSVGSGTSGEENNVGHFALGNICGPPVSSLGVRFAVRVVAFCDLLGHSCVGLHGSYALFDQPGPYLFPQLDQRDLSVTDNFAVSAAGTFVHCVYEIRVERYFPFQRFVQSICLCELVQIVDLSPGRN